MKARLKAGDWIRCSDKEDIERYLKALEEDGYNAVAAGGMFIRITGDQMKLKESKERRAVHIAAVVMEAAGLCIREERDLCESEPTQEGCTACIERWLYRKANEELRKEKEHEGRG